MSSFANSAILLLRVFGLPRTSRSYASVCVFGYMTRRELISLPLRSEEDRYVAIKVYTIEATRASRHDRNPEVMVLKKLSQTSSDFTHDNDGTEPCLEAEKAFVTKSRHGKHLSVATRPYSLSMFEFLFHVPPHRFPLHIAKRVITRTLLALDSLHSAGYVHTGATPSYELCHCLCLTCVVIADVKLENVFLSLSSPAQQEEISKHVIESPPETYPPRSDPQLCSEEPIITAKSQPLPPFVLWSHEYCLGEFGQGKSVCGVNRVVLLNHGIYSCSHSDGQTRHGGYVPAYTCTGGDSSSFLVNARRRMGCGAHGMFFPLLQYQHKF